MECKKFNLLFNEVTEMSEKVVKIILIFCVSFLVINVVGYLFNISEFVTIMNNPTGGGGSSISNIPTILSILLTCVILLIIKFKNNKK